MRDRGVSKTGGIAYTYEHAEEIPTSGEAFYRVSTVIRYIGRPIHVNRHYVPAARLDAFLCRLAECGEQVWDVRPVTAEQVAEELASYRPMDDA